MAVQVDGGSSDGGDPDELKTQFYTREGTYRLMTLSEYSRPNRVGYTNTQGNASVRVSFVNLPDPSGNGDRICFNFGRELYVYVYKGVKKAADLTKPVDKKMYKGTNPTCHDFNSVTMTSDTVSLLVGFSTGQIQLIDPIKKELSKLYNEERLIDKTKVTCIKWVPGSTNLFLASHSSGQLYLYNEELPCGTTAPHYQPFKQGDGYAIHTCKTKSTRNPLYRWVLGSDGCCINELAFSPCGSYLAVVSQDGFLRVFHYDTMELVGVARSYFGGFLCVCWSPDGRYVVVGGEDDLVTVWSFHERRVVARGQGHRSWVSVVAFDPFTSSCSGVKVNGASSSNSKVDFSDSDSESSFEHKRTSSNSDMTCYRLGSVGQDTQLCLWDITEDVLRQPMCPRTRTTSTAGLGNLSGSKTLNGNGAPAGSAVGTGTGPIVDNTKCNSIVTNSVGSKDKSGDHSSSNSHHSGSTLSQKLAAFGFGDRKEGHKRNFSIGPKSSSSSDKSHNSSTVKSTHSAADDPMRLIGTSTCPRFDECPLLEPLICKKIAHERLTALVFREDCFVTACQDGYVYTWARPGKLCGGPGLSNIPSSPGHVSLGNNNAVRVTSGNGDNAGISPGNTTRSSPDPTDSIENTPTSVV
ncbi:WD repeat-containing protein 20 isoform X1 [Frankliniella occidentalis]|uniref:WD repeat-containing protein 20 isoform X1 n=1 Tax=Frankliniella occidentalis TaxID=133901 RepID=A0A6J1RZX0_FRAOC|nr:WD repeat-containing protein 20 isoform X1 [Frankliniella occidentalis]